MDTTPTDISGVVEASESAALALALEAAQMGTWEADLRANTVYWSARIADLLGFSSAPRTTSTEEWFSHVHPDDRPLVEARLAEALQRKTIYESEFRWLRPDGQTRWMAARGQVICDGDGTPVRLVGVAYDTTDRKRGEEKLREGQARLHAALKAGQMGVWDWNRRTGQIVWEGEHERLLGLAPGAFDGTYDGFEKSIHPDDRAGIRAAVEEASRNRVPYEHAYRVIWPDGSVHWMAGRGEFIYDAAGQPVRMVGTIQSIDAGKRAEEDLLRHNERLRLLSDAAAFLLESRETEQMARGIYERIGPHVQADVCLNYMLAPSSDTLRLHFCAGLSPASQQAIQVLALGQAVCGSVAQTGERAVVSDLQNGQDPHAALLSAEGVRAFACHPLRIGGRVIGTLAFGSRHRDSFNPEDLSFMQTASQYMAIAHERAHLLADLRDRATQFSLLIQAQREVAQAEPNLTTRLRLVAEKAQQVAHGTGAAVARVEGEDLVYVAASGTLRECIGSRLRRDTSIIGFTVKEARPQRSDDTETDERVDREMCRRFGARSLLTVPLVYNRTTVGVLTIGSDRPFAFTDEHLTSAEVMSSIAVAAMSAFAALEAREALSTVEDRLRLAVEAARIGVWSWEFGSDRIYWSPEMYALFGLPDGAPMTLEATRAPVHPEDRHRIEQALQKALSERAPYLAEARILWPDGTERWTSAEGRVAFAEDGTPLRLDGVMLDVTDQKRLQAQLLQAQKMEGLGRLAGGIAHDFNNLLSVILGYAELVQIELNETSPLLPSVRNIETAANRAAALTRQLLAFARRQATEPRVVDLNALLSSMGAMLRPLLGERVELHIRPEAGPSLVTVDPNQIEQVIVNLAVNARDAMPEGGTLLIQTDNASLEGGQTQDEAGIVNGPYVRISVTDTGVGMSAAVKSRVFDPFFTTKEVGKGTGLGLATCYGIVRQHHGYIWVYSEEGVGTTFRIYLPLAAEAAVGLTAPSPPAKAARGTATILVVEDEQLVRNLVVGALTAQGYTVLQATNGVEALTVVEAHEGRIDLLLTDLIMPQMGGEALAQRVRAARPGIKVIYMSGYAEDMATLRGMLPANSVLLEKPVPPSALLPKVEELLAS